jgi:hypothetical protein
MSLGTILTVVPVVVLLGGFPRPARRVVTAEVNPAWA